VPQGNPEGFRTSIPSDLQEIVIATIHKLFRENRHGYAFSFDQDKEVFTLSHLSGFAVTNIPYFVAREGGVDLMMAYALNIEEKLNDDQKAEVQESGSERKDSEAI